MIKLSRLQFTVCRKVRHGSTIVKGSFTKTSSFRFDHDRNLKTLKKNTLTHKQRLNMYLKSNPRREKLKPLIPDELFARRKNIDYLYLVDPAVAEIVATHIVTYLQTISDRVIAECYPGLGLITNDILRHNIYPIRLYEPSLEFRNHLQKQCDKYGNCVQLFSKDLFKIASYAYLDKKDNGSRVEEILTGIPKKSWASDPVMTIIGTTENTVFLRSLAKMIAMQTSMVAYGRIELFLIMRPKDYIVLTAAEIPFDMKSYKYITIIFNLFFDFKLIEKLPRKAFLPWDVETKYINKPKIRTIDEEKLYLTYISCKKNLPLPLDQLVPFYFFIKQLFKGTKKIVPTLENWVPGCGENIIQPKLNHTDYYDDMSILTEFRDLTPEQMVDVFREMCNHPSYIGSPFLGMVESELLKSDTIEARSYFISQDLEKRIVDDIESTCEDN